MRILASCVVAVLGGSSSRAQESPPANQALLVFGERTPLAGYGGGFMIAWLSVDADGTAQITDWTGTESGSLQLGPTEVEDLVRLIERTQADPLRDEYGDAGNRLDSHAVWITFGRGDPERTVTWLEPPSEPAPPEAWIKLADHLTRVRDRIRRDPSHVPPGF